MSLITYHESNDSYSIHPVVHKWARKRPGMSASEQAIWAHAAKLTLSHSILLPPLADTENDEIFRRDILSHIDHVRSCQSTIDLYIQKRRQSRFGGYLNWPAPGSTFGPSQAILYAKFSSVFAQNGRWNYAETLQLQVKEFADSVLGLDQPITRQIALALSSTYWNQGRGDEAADLQEIVLKACLTYLGPQSHETLITMETLGQTRWQQGRYTEAKGLQQKAVEGLIKLRNSKMHEDILSAMGHLGRTLAKFYEDLDEAKCLLEETCECMDAVLGPTHLKSMEIQEDLAMLTVQMGNKEDLPIALNKMRHILDCRKEKLGKEHPYTLLAMVSLSRVKIALREYDEAEDLIRSGLQIADRNLGEHHIGTLMGKTVLATILIHQSRFSEAEDILHTGIERQRGLSVYRGDFHPDRIGAMIELPSVLEFKGN
ncbi:uncharacterized protein N7483_012478 [Penicillium malachiteum]|uniref:uncharacterized protein n=1 Tax=Penicillium malachiteum TaxID=1324776 RepID=UPI002548B801|nr:uncharacterized protein N7483_012478 [Penicillium malachiteum]KAJ5715297.1 hypothetical protein N7483_012478 [Penicillium malachiteum]